MRSTTIFLACALSAVLTTIPRAEAPSAGASTAPLSVTSARVSLDGTTNIHPYSASTSSVRIVDIEVAGAGANLFDRALQPGGLTAFEIAIPATSLTSPREGVDKNMHKALKAGQFAEIRFRLKAIQPASGGNYTAAGWLTVAGIEKEVTLNLQVRRNAAALAVTGTTDLLMTDYGITPPKAMMGMLKTNPKVQITIELVLDDQSLT
jgi:polyisoprenoid-binding protein YceI